MFAVCVCACECLYVWHICLYGKELNNSIKQIITPILLATFGLNVKRILVVARCGARISTHQNLNSNFG